MSGFIMGAGAVEVVTIPVTEYQRLKAVYEAARADVLAARQWWMAKQDAQSLSTTYSLDRSLRSRMERDRLLLEATATTIALLALFPEGGEG